MDCWNPMKDAFKQPSFNSYVSGPGAGIPDRIQPANKWMAEGQANFGQHQSSRLEAIQLFVNYLPVAMKEQSLKTLFSEVGEVVYAKRAHPKLPNSSHTYGFVTFLTLREAEEAMRRFNGYEISSKRLYVNFARNDREPRTKGTVLKTPGVEEEILHFASESLAISDAKKFFDNPFRKNGDPGGSFSDCGQRGDSPLHYGNESGSPVTPCRSEIFKSEEVKRKNSQDLDGEVLGSKRTQLRDLKSTEVEVGSQLLCMVSEWRSTRCFYIQPFSPVILRTLRLVVEQQLSSPPGYHPIAGEVFLGCYSEDQGWYRAVLEDTNATEGMYNVLYIDFGNHETISADSICVLPKELAVLPICGIRCRIATTRTPQGQGTDDVLKKKFLNHAVHVIFQKFDEEMQTWSVNISLQDVLTREPSLRNDPVLPPLLTGEPSLSNDPVLPPFLTGKPFLSNDPVLPPLLTGELSLSNDPVLPPFLTGKPSLSNDPVLPPFLTSEPSLSNDPVLPPFLTGQPSSSNDPVLPPFFTGKPSLSNDPVLPPFPTGDPSLSNDPVLPPFLTGEPSTSNDPVLPPSAKEIPKSSLVQYRAQTIFEEEEYFLVLICEVVDPSHFYFQRVDGLEHLYGLMREIAVHCESLEPENFSPQEGDIVCAQYTEDDTWYRAHVLGLMQGNTACVSYVDFGTSEILSVSRLRPSKVEFLHLSFKAFCCSLAGVKPVHESWGSDAQMTFKQIVWNRTMKAKVIGETESGALVVELILSPDPDERSDIPGSLAQRLVDAGVAKLSIEVAESEHTTPSIVADDYTKKWEYSHLPLHESCAVLVTVVAGPSEFYCRLASIAVEQELLHLMEELMTICSSLPSEPILEPVLNQPYCAQYSVDGLWYRALVVATCGPDGVPVRYADFGNGESVPMARLRPIPVEYLQLPRQAIHCYLEADPSVAETSVLKLHEGQFVNVLALACTGPDSYSVRLCNSDSSPSHGGLQEAQQCKDVQDDYDFENSRPLSVTALPELLTSEQDERVHALLKQLTSEQDESVKNGEWVGVTALLQEFKDQMDAAIDKIMVVSRAIEEAHHSNVV
uniref:tudor domain-containing protein 1-like isoform X2 n=1 Tax=Myxine glutinosa TaxID=7769 RepID=UPI00358E7ACE